MSCLETSSPVKDHKIIHQNLTRDHITLKFLIHVEFIVVSIKCLQLFLMILCRLLVFYSYAHMLEGL